MCLCVIGPAVVLALFLPEQMPHGWVVAPSPPTRKRPTDTALRLRCSRHTLDTTPSVSCSHEASAGLDSAIGRRGGALLVASLSSPLPAHAEAETRGPVAVLGAAGVMGLLCLEALRREGRSSRGLTRNEADLTSDSEEDLAKAFQGSQAVIFTSVLFDKSDVRTLAKAATACELAGVPKFVVATSKFKDKARLAQAEEAVKAALLGSKTQYSFLFKPEKEQDFRILAMDAIKAADS